MNIRLALTLAVLVAPAAAQEFVYGLNIFGKLTVNGTVLDSMPTEFDADTGQNSLERWFALDVVGSDRFAMRLDGRIHKNGKKLYALKAATDGTLVFAWTGLDATTGGHVHGLRQEGMLNTDGVDVVAYPRGNFFFTQVAANSVLDEDSTYSLRSDGAVFTGLVTTPAAQFKAAESGEPLDGVAPQTIWVDAAIDVVGGKLFVLRADGELWSEDLADIDAFAAGSTTADGEPVEPPAGAQVAELPFPVTPSTADLYANLRVADGEWRVLRVDGALFTDASVLDPLADYAGDGSSDESFVGLAVSGDTNYAVRIDGFVFKDDEENEHILNLVGDEYVALAVGTLPPDLTNFKNPQPKPSPYTVKVLEGEAVSIPVLVSDIEKLSDDLLVEEDPNAPLPAGATFQEVTDIEGHVTRTIEWDGTQPAGTYSCKLTVDDDDDPQTKPRKFTTKITVLAPDTDPEKNKLPKPAKIKLVQALVDHEVSFPILAEDIDGDPLTISVNTEKKPFTLPSAPVFDELTNTFTWTPTFDDIGTHSVKFLVNDGTKTKSLTVKVKVVSGLIFEEPEP